MSAVRVSVVIPCHNSLRFLPDTLDSVLAQELPPDVAGPLDVVLVDDGGDDDLAGWAAQRRDPGVRVVRQPNAGVSAARNRGIAEAEGELISFCDSDDLWLPSTVRDLVACFTRDPGIGLAYGWYDIVDAQGFPTGSLHRSDIAGDAWERLVLDNPIAASGVMVAAPVLAQVGGFAQNRDRFRIDVEDWELWIRIAASHRVGLAPSVVVHHRRHDDNSSSDVDSLEAAYHHLLDTVFADVDPRRAALRPEATARAESILAWKSLNDRRDPRRAQRHLHRARSSWPPLARSPEYWRLRVAAGALRLTGPRGYAAVRRANDAIRRGRRALTRT